MYIFIITILSILAFLEIFNRDITENYKALFAFICFSLLVFQDGFRWETGTDWTVYRTYFEQLTLDYDWNTGDSEYFDIGYVLFCYALRIFTDNYTIFLVLYSLIFYSIFFYFIFKLSNSPFVSLLLFYMVTIYYMGMNRQFMAMEFYALALVCLTNNKKPLFFLCITLGFFFHKTILLGLIALFVNKKIPNYILVIILVIVSLIALSGIINKLPLNLFAVFGEQSSDKIDLYSTNTDVQASLLNSILSLIRKLIWIVPLMIYEERIKKMDNYYLLFNLYFIGVVFYILFNGTILQVIVARGLIYFNLMEIFIAPYALSLLKQNYGKLLIMFLVVAYVFVNVYKGFSGLGDDTDYFVPYKGIFINTDYQRQSI